MQKKLGILLGCIIIVVVLGLVLFQEKETTIESYRVYQKEGLISEETLDFLCETAKTYQGVKLKTTTKEDTGNIYLICEETFANTKGRSLNGLQEHAFVIENKNQNLYLYAKDEMSLKRAVSYLMKELVDDDKKVVLESGESYSSYGKEIKQEVYVGDTPIEEYTITYAQEDAKTACEELQYYIFHTAEDYLPICASDKSQGAKISLMLNESITDNKPIIQIVDGQISIEAKDEKTLKKGVYLFANTYLGWMNAGEADAQISSVASVVRIPQQVVEQTPWMEEREATIVLWNPNFNRGFYLDGDTSLKNNIIEYSDEQLYEYVKMLKYCGFTGIQVTEMCSTWAGVGGYKAAHEKIRTLADAAHSLDMKFTLWVWGAEFNGYGWVDNSVVYTPAESGRVCDNPEAVAVFDKYYSIYAELADCCDRLIAHYYDPGNLHNADDIAYFAKMLKDKFHAVNPEIDFGISCWVDIYNKNTFVNALGNDITLYECGQRDDESEYVRYRTDVKNLGCRIGTWGWNTCEMEIDQLAQMNFNMDIIRIVYQTARKYDEIQKSSYWSEMDAYHVLNVFSLYCAGQMLINPDIESEVLYQQISTAAVGPGYAEEFADILSIIQDARTGSSWDTYVWSKPNYILKNADYPAQDILERCNKSIPKLQEMIDSGIESYTLPLPISLQDVLQMMLPHLEQIRSFAQFRIGLAQLEADYAKQNMTPEMILERVEMIYEPVKDYNCIIGTWGQIEARAQQELLLAFCEKAGVTMPKDPVFDRQRKQYIIAQAISFQKGKTTPYYIAAPYYQWGLAYGEAESNRLVDELVEEGLLVREKENVVYLKDWENYIYHFDEN